MKTAVLITLLALGMIPPVWGAQMEAKMTLQETTIHPSLKFLRVIVIDYSQGGELAKILQNQNYEVSFSINSKTHDLSELISKINRDLFSKSSSTMVTEATINYEANLSGKKDSAFIEYKVEIVPTITNYVIREQVGQFPALYDAQWRGIKISGQVIIQTESGGYDINNPVSFLKSQAPEVWDKLQGTTAQDLLEMELLDASGILNSPLSRWHSLFDPTPIIEESKKAGFTESAVITHYSLGECNIESGPCIDKKWSQDILLDKEYTVRVIESQDDATISIEGYVTDTILGDAEIFGVSPQPPPDYSNPATGSFPAMVIYGMAGMAAVGGGAFFLFSNRQLKKSENQGQQGIDPSKVRAYSTSSASGGYQTTRGEAQLIDDTEYQKTRSVYDGSNDNMTKRSGALPKGWRQSRSPE